MGYDREDIAAGNMRLADLTPPEWRASAARALVGIDTTGASNLMKGVLAQGRQPRACADRLGRVRRKQDHGVAFVLD